MNVGNLHEIDDQYRSRSWTSDDSQTKLLLVGLIIHCPAVSRYSRQEMNSEFGIGAY